MQMQMQMQMQMGNSMNRFLSLVLLSGLILMAEVSLDGATSKARAAAQEKSKEAQAKNAAAAATASPELPLTSSGGASAAAGDSSTQFPIPDVNITAATPQQPVKLEQDAKLAGAAPLSVEACADILAKDMDAQGRSKIIRILNILPAMDRTDAFITQVLSLSEGVDRLEIWWIMDTLVKVPKADRTQEFTTQVQSLITPAMNGYDRRVVIIALRKVPAAVRPAFIRQVPSLMTPTMSGSERSFVIASLERVAAISRPDFVQFCQRNRVLAHNHITELSSVQNPGDWAATLAGIRNVAPNQIIGLNNQSVHAKELEASIQESVQKLQKLYPIQYKTLVGVEEAIKKRMESLQKQNLLKPVDARIMGVFLSGAQVLTPDDRAKILRYFDLTLQALDDKKAAVEAASEAAGEEAYDKAIRNNANEAEAKKAEEAAKKEALKKEFTPKEMDDRFSGWLRSGPIDAQLAYILDNLGGKAFKDKNALYEALEKNFEANVGGGRSCLGGSYNRLIIALNKLHPAVKIDYGQATKANAQLLWLRNALQKQGKELVEKAKKEGTSEDALRKVGPEVLQKFVESQQKAELNFLTPEKINATVEAYLQGDFERALLDLHGKDGITAYIEDGGMEKDVRAFLGSQKNPFDTTLLARAREATEKGVEAMLKKHADMSEEERKEHLQTAKSLVPGILGAYQTAYLKEVAQKVIATLPNKAVGAAGSETMEHKADRMDVIETHLKAEILKALGELVSKENEKTVGDRIQDILGDDGIMALWENKALPTEKDSKSAAAAAPIPMPSASGSMPPATDATAASISPNGATASVKK